MFNWFRRQFGKDNAAPESAPPEGTEVSAELAPEVIQAETESPSEEDAQKTELATPTPEQPNSDNANPDDYLQWAKAAYQNIQARKAETVTPPESPAEITIEAEKEETTEERFVVPESDQAKAIEETPPSPATEVTTGPAWLQKSDRLEALKETAVEEATVAGTLTAESMTMDDDFMWSAKVLAAQGRSAADVSAEEIDWLRKLRQGLSKTRVNLVNQLKSIVGQGPLNDAAVEEIEAILLQADVGVEATDYIITTLQDKLREEALPPEPAMEFL